MQNADAIRARCRTNIGFVREAWHVLEPRTPFVEGWATRAICDHLQAITFGEFLRLALPNDFRANVPPGMTKSLLISVLWNAWEWGPCNLAHHKFLSTSYSGGYVTRDTRKSRDLIDSPWYQSLWGKDAVGRDEHGDCRDRVVLTRKGDTSFENTKHGTREGVPFDSLTGGRGDRVTVDDPLSVAQSKSEADREHAKFITREALPSRKNDPVKSSIVMIQQRVHKEDPSGVWEDLKVPHIALVLPMRFIASKRCVTPIFTDPRTIEGELLFPERFPLAVVNALETTMTPYAVSGQHQQEPIPREGGMFKRVWFILRTAMPVGYRWCRHWDLADTEATYGVDPPYTAGLLLGKPLSGFGKYVIADVVRCREEAPTTRKLIKQTALLDRDRIMRAQGTYEVQVVQDPGSSGKTVRRDLISMLDGFDAHWLIESGSKIDRAEPIATQAENGNVEIVIGSWNEPFLDEAGNFPGIKFKDQVDAMSGAYARLQLPARRRQEAKRNVALPIFQR